jgi:hypothetical protein
MLRDSFVLLDDFLLVLQVLLLGLFASLYRG